MKNIKFLLAIFIGILLMNSCSTQQVLSQKDSHSKYIQELRVLHVELVEEYNITNEFYECSTEDEEFQNECYEQHHKEIRDIQYKFRKKNNKLIKKYGVGSESINDIINLFAQE